MLDLTSASVIYCFVLAAVFLGLWMYYDRRDHALFEQSRRKSTFFCIRCSHLYSATGQPELCKCPRCGFENSRLKF